MHEEHSIPRGGSIYPRRNFYALLLLLKTRFFRHGPSRGNQSLILSGLQSGLTEKVSMLSLSLRVLLFFCLSATSAAVMAVPYLSIQ